MSVRVGFARQGSRCALAVVLLFVGVTRRNRTLVLRGRVAGCSGAVKKVVEKIDGVTECTADHDGSACTVDCACACMPGGPGPAQPRFAAPPPAALYAGNLPTPLTRSSCSPCHDAAPLISHRVRPKRRQGDGPIGQRRGAEAQGCGGTRHTVQLRPPAACRVRAACLCLSASMRAAARRSRRLGLRW